MRISRFRAGLMQAERLADRFTGRFNRKGRNMGSDMARGFKTAFLGALSAVGLTAGAATVGALVGKTFIEAVKSAAEAERFEMSLGALLGDTKAGEDLFAQFRADAMRTGQDIASIGNTTRKFIGLGFSQEDAVQLQRSILDVAGSLGLTKQETDLLGAALAQVQAKGVASMEELRQQIAEKGIPIFQELAAKMGMTEGQLIKLISEGKVAAKEVIDLFKNLEGGFARFAGGAERMAETTGGAWEVLKAHIADVRLDMGRPIADSLRPLIRDLTEMVEDLRDEAVAFGESIGDAIDTARAAIQEFSRDELLSAAGMGLKLAFLEAVGALEKGVEKALEVFGDERLWTDFESRLVAIGRSFVEEIVMGGLEFLNIMGRTAKVVERVWNPDTGMFETRTRNMLPSERAAADGQAPSRFREILDEIMDPQSRGEEVKRLRDDLAEMLERLETQKVINQVDETNRRAKLDAEINRKEEAAGEPPVALFSKDLYHREMAAIMKRAGFTGLAEMHELQFKKSGAEFPGLAELEALQGRKGNQNLVPGGGGSGGGGVSLAEAVDMIGGGGVEPILNEQTGLLRNIERHLAEIKRERPDTRAAAPTVKGVGIFGTTRAVPMGSVI